MEIITGGRAASRDQVRRGVLACDPAPVFVPVHVVDRAPPADASVVCPAPASRVAPAEAAGGRIEIASPDGTLIRIPEEIGAAALRRVLTALRR